MPDAARVERGGVHVAALHQAEHLPGVAADLQGLAVELALEGVERAHDVGDGAVAVLGRVRCLGAFGQLQDARVGLADHLLAVVDPDQVLLEDVVVEHVLRGLAEVDDPLGEVRRLHAVRHVLRVHRAGRVVVTADPADAAGDEVRVAGVLAPHEHAVATEDRRGAVALGHPLLLEVDLRVDAEAAHDPGDRVPGHLHQAAAVAGSLRLRCHVGAAPFLGVARRLRGVRLPCVTTSCAGRYMPPVGCGVGCRPEARHRAVGTRWSSRRRCGATSVPCRRSWP